MDFGGALKDLGAMNPQRAAWLAAFELDDRRSGESILAWWDRKAATVSALASSANARNEDLARLRELFVALPDGADLAAQEQARADQNRRSLAEFVVSQWYAPRVVAAAMGGEATRATAAVDRWYDKGKPRSMMLRGGVGVGKTVAAARWLVREICAGVKRDEVGSFRHDAIVGPVLHLYDDRNKPLPRLVVVDDVGRETKADFVEALCAVLDEGKRTLLMTSNLTREQMRARYDARLLDRLNDECLAVDIAGESRRRQDGGF